jgi:predicted  nucleic acid-binding Zn-ribbon protein
MGGAFGENGRMSRIQGFEKALWNVYDATYTIGDNTAYSRVTAIAKGYANDSGRIVRAESTRWENKAKALSAMGANPEVNNQLNTLIGDDAWKSVREIAEDVVAKNGGGGGDVSQFEEQINTLIGKDSDMSVREIANDVVSDNVVSLEDADTAQEVDGIVSAVDAITFFGDRLESAIAEEVKRANGVYISNSTFDVWQGKVNDLGDEINALSDDVKDIQDNMATQDDVKAIDKEIEDVNNDVSALDNRIKQFSYTATVAYTNANTALTTLDTLTGDGEGSISRQITEEVASIMASAPDDLEMLEKIADFLEADPTQAADIVTKLDDHESRLDNIEKNKIVVLSQSEYDAIEQKSEDTLYFIYEE